MLEIGGGVFVYPEDITNVQFFKKEYPLGGHDWKLIVHSEDRASVHFSYTNKEFLLAHVETLRRNIPGLMVIETL